jgi:hypothetical protein
MTPLGAVLSTLWTLIDDGITARCALSRDLNEIICDASWISFARNRSFEKRDLYLRLLEMVEGREAFPLHTVVRAPRAQRLVFLHSSTGPRDDRSVDRVTPADTKGQR